MSEDVKVPEGWKRVRLGEIARFFKGRSYLKNDVNDNGEYEFIHYGELFTTYNERIKEIVSHIDNAKNAFLSKVNDVLMPTSDVTPSGLATASCIKKNDVILGSDILVIRSKENIEGIYLTYAIRSNKTKILQFVRGTTVYHLYASDLANFDFLLPPLPEQQKIAEILETVDNAIEKTEKIIEKYKRIKQGLMQDLLTKGIDENGRIRSEKTHKFKDSPIGRIPEEWEVVRLGEVCFIIMGQSPSSALINREEKGIPFLQGNAEFTSKYPNPINWIEKPLKIAKKESILLSVRAPVGALNIADREYCIGRGLCSIVTNKNITHNLFIWYYLQFSINNLINLSQGSTFEAISSRELKNYFLPLPPLPEQQRIAEILSQIDNTIEKEEAYKQKLEHIKKGLMEDLLTGKVRVNKLIKEEDKK